MADLSYPPFLDAATKGFATALVAAAAVVMATHAAVRRGKLKPYGGLARTVRQFSDPFLQPLERRLVRIGGNPQDAGLWLLGLAAVAGLLVVMGARWIFGMALAVTALGDVSPATRAALVIDWLLAMLNLMILIRFILSWFGMSPHSWPIRITRFLTEWLVGPIRRRLPQFGMIDLSPAAAYLLVLVVRALVRRLLVPM